MEDGDDFEIERVGHPVDDEIGKARHFQFTRFRYTPWTAEERKALQLIDRGQDHIDHSYGRTLAFGRDVVVDLFEVRFCRVR